MNKILNKEEKIGNKQKGTDIFNNKSGKLTFLTTNHYQKVIPESSSQSLRIRKLVFYNNSSRKMSTFKTKETSVILEKWHTTPKTGKQITKRPDFRKKKKKKEKKKKPSAEKIIVISLGQLLGKLPKNWG